jgi:hypothetical protein
LEAEGRFSTLTSIALGAAAILIHNVEERFGLLRSTVLRVRSRREQSLPCPRRHSTTKIGFEVAADIRPSPEFKVSYRAVAYFQRGKPGRQQSV